MENYDVDREGKSGDGLSVFLRGQMSISEIAQDKIKVRTYERGWRLNLACGTGVPASSIASFVHGAKGYTTSGRRVRFEIQALGDYLAVDFLPIEGGMAFEDIWLTGPATCVFETEVEL